MKRNKEFLVAGIQNLMKTNYNVEIHQIDVESEVDSSIGFTENWENIKPKVLQLCEKPHKMLFQ
jgi:hypothetical protein